MNYEINETSMERVYVLKEGSLSSNILQLEEILNEFIKNDDRDIIVDLQYVNKIDSMSLATLLRVKKKLIENDRNLSLTNPNETVMRVIELAGLDSYLLD